MSGRSGTLPLPEPHAEILDRLARRYGGIWPIAGAEDPPAGSGGEGDNSGDNSPDNRDNSGGSGDDDKLPDAVREVLRKERQAAAEAKREAAAARKERDALKAEKDQRDQADLTETQRAAAERDRYKEQAETLSEKYARLQLEREIERTAGKLGFADVEDATAYLTLHASEIERDDDGAPTNIEKLLKALLERKPHLKSGGDGKGGGIPNTPKPQDTKSREELIAENRRRLAESGQYARM